MAALGPVRPPPAVLRPVRHEGDSLGIRTVRFFGSLEISVPENQNRTVRFRF
jgi:hypothetical protein